MSEDIQQYEVSTVGRAFSDTYSATQPIVDMLDILQRALDLSKSEVVRLAIRELYERTMQPTTDTGLSDGLSDKAAAPLPAPLHGPHNSTTA